jgi:uncharacterized membrane protein YjgN (DUF898 family)
MKKYFDFTLTGKKFLPIWLIFYILIIMPYAFYYKSLTGQAQSGNPNPMIGFLFLGIMIIAFLISYYILKLTIENVKYNNNKIDFNGKFSIFLGKVLLGFLLSIVTLTIYMAWFIRDITRFVVNNSSIEGTRFEFKGKGGILFLILILSLFAPIIVLSLVMGKHLIALNKNFLYTLMYQGIVMIIMIPYMYLMYKWMIDIKYKDYHIKWKTDFFESCGKILVEILLIMITVGIYMPLAYLKLFKYFSERTIAEKADSSLQFGYELDSKNDFLFIWGQLLLTIITLGIYYPWAYAKIGKRILGKTYVTIINAA